MKLLKFAAKSRRLTTKRTLSKGLSIENYGRDQLKELARKGLSFQIEVL
jgi:hypothetical protein